MWATLGLPLVLRMRVGLSRIPRAGAYSRTASLSLGAVASAEAVEIFVLPGRLRRRPRPRVAARIVRFFSRPPVRADIADEVIQHRSNDRRQRPLCLSN